MSPLARLLCRFRPDLSTLSVRLGFRCTDLLCSEEPCNKQASPYTCTCACACTCIRREGARLFRLRLASDNLSTILCTYSQVAALCAARLNGSAPLPERLGLCERWLEVLPRHLKPLCDAAWSHATLGGARVVPLASSGRTWRHWAELAAQHAQWERCLNAKPLPRGCSS